MPIADCRLPIQMLYGISLVSFRWGLIVPFSRCFNSFVYYYSILCWTKTTISISSMQIYFIISWLEFVACSLICSRTNLMQRFFCFFRFSLFIFIFVIYSFFSSFNGGWYMWIRDSRMPLHGCTKLYTYVCVWKISSTKAQKYHVRVCIWELVSFFFICGMYR